MAKIILFLGCLALTPSAFALTMCLSNGGTTYLPVAGGLSGSNGVLIKLISPGVWIASDRSSTVYNQLGKNLFGSNGETLTCY